ncbi:response regulator [Limibacillus halophilus]|uniref:CheY-like chemotaxis protein n=1 Tax=Limibacillus halophilus TaxID=1579333 RepID=A0A839T024_9PROT|nr:response regulator [Limibacillus halophilus]MBB3066503.1 CheY-like chemotaxis protein [Limibacillus halophilus]
MFGNEHFVKTNQKAAVLIVDDNPLTRRSVNLWLTRAGYRVAEAETPSIAIQTLQRDTFDVILVDYDLPQMSGADLTQNIHEQHLAANRPAIICMTGARPDNLGNGCAYDDPFTAWIDKPFELSSLEILVETHGSAPFKPLQAKVDPTEAKT